MRKLLILLLISGSLFAQSDLSSKLRAKDSGGRGLSRNDYSDAERTRVTTNTNALFNYFPEQIIEISGAFIAAPQTVTANSGSKYTVISATERDSIRVTAVFQGAAIRAAIYISGTGATLGTQGTGANGVDSVWTRRRLNIPAGTRRIYITSRTTSRTIVERYTLRFNTLFSTISPNVPVSTQETSSRWASIGSGNSLQQNVSASRKFAVFSATPGDSVLITTAVNGAAVPIALYANASGTMISDQGRGRDGSDSLLTDYRLAIPVGTTTIYVNGNFSSPIIIKRKSSAGGTSIATTQWTGKTILLMGTSIGEGGGYPTGAPALLGATGINQAKGSSVVRIANANGTITNIPWENYIYALGHTIAEKISIINNWSTIRVSLAGTPPTTLTPADTSLIIGCSFQKRLLPYLDGTFPMPALFVFDHGRNDNFSSDNDSLWTQSPKSNWRLNRNTWAGGTNVLIELILRYNPQARIAIISHNTNKGSWARVVTGQRLLADYWNLPFLDLSQRLGWSDQLAPGSQSLWSNSPWSLYTSGQNTSADMPVYRIWNPDGVHPYVSWSRTLLTNVVYEFLRGIY